MKTRNSHGLLQLHVGREALAHCQCLYQENKALFVSVDLIGEKNQVIFEYIIKVRGKHFNIGRASKLHTANRLKRTTFNNKMKVQKFKVYSHSIPQPLLKEMWVPVKCETKQKRNGTKRNRSKQNETNRNETKQIETKRNKSKRNETIRNETNRNETKQMIWQDIVDKNRSFLCNDMYLSCT